MQEKSMYVRPPERAHPSTLSFPRSGKQSMPKGSILVIDDESEIREGLELLLTSEGYGVSCAGTGESGITKPWSNDELLAQVAQAVESRRLREENVQLKRALKQRFNFPSIIGKSEKMLTLLDLVTQVAPSRSTVL